MRLILMACVCAAIGGCAVWSEPPRSSVPSAAAAAPGIQVAQNARGRGNGLPPGIAKQLARGKPLPPGLAKRRVPPAQLRTLPPARDGFEYLVVAGKVVLIETATQVVHDILTDVLLD